MSVANPTATALPGRLLRMTLQIYRNQTSTTEDREKFARDYLSKVTALHAKNGIEIYQQVYTPVNYRAALDEMNRRNNRGWVIDDHDLTVEFYFRNFAELNKVNTDPEFQALQASEGLYVNLVHTVVTLGWVEKHVDGGKAVNLGPNGKSLYPPWSELNDLSTAFAPAQPAAEGLEKKDEAKI
ncbi:hypothetical protein B0T22DRAFT_300078 [Podospora appendiculata]|uniref:EthD domain-containing protein n=1 Tax=Podospora appendiculata TaxID=314037 RepID=A0AAE0X014_9PEZI|nr:hypothetical protein B0T22DRAFT_300078 [Podospora appendiculata]